MVDTSRFIVLLISGTMCVAVGFELNYLSNIYEPTSEVKVTLYYETMCPDCQEWSKNQLCPVVEKLSKYFYIEFVPYGNAETKVNNETGEVEIFCQHGSDECEGNRIQSCALQKLSYLQSTRFICCMESESSFEPKGQRCLKKLGIDVSSIVNCANGPEGQKLHYLNGLKTQKLNPSPNGVPWIIFNDQFQSDEEMDAAQLDFVSVLCKYIKDPKPVECQRITVKLI